MRSFLKWWWYTVRCHYNAVQYNMILHTSLYWSRAFDLINRHMLFYKLIKARLHGRIVDTLCNLYAKKQFRIKCNGSLSPLLETSTGVNQGGYVRSCLFRSYLADLTDFLTTSVGVRVEEETLLHLLWADDLLMACQNNWMTFPSSVPKIWWYWMKWRRWFTAPRNISILGN